MVRRLLSFLLVLCLSVPAVAAPAHCEPVPQQSEASGHAHHAMAAPSEPRPDQPSLPDPQTRHDCIGCVVPTGGMGGVAERDRPSGLVRTIGLARTLLSAASTPDLPPPRV